jgi:hypothetical protein
MNSPLAFAAEEINERYLSLTRQQVARALNISLDALDEMHARDEGPPRFRATPRRWAYPALGFRRWQEQRLIASDNAA